MKVTDVVDMTIALSATPPSQASFGVSLLLVDHSDVPIDRRYRILSRDSYVADLTASTTHLAWYQTLWGQNRNPAVAYIGRWVSSASNPHFICGTHNATVSDWVAISDGCFTVTTTAGADILASLNFTSVTSIADVLTVIQTALTAGGLSGATVALDAIGRIVFTDPAVSGAGSDTVVISASGTGTHLELAAWLNAVGGFAVGGLDAESLGAAASAVFAKDNTPFACAQLGGSISEQVAFSTAINAMDKIELLVNNDANAKDAAETTDVGYQINALSHKKTWIGYTEHLTQYPDAAICGEILPALEATISFALTPLNGVSESGLDPDGTTIIPLTAGEVIALNAKGYDHAGTIGNSTVFRNGLSAGGTEMRIMIGKSFMAAKCNEDIVGYMIANNVVTFSQADLDAIRGIIIFWADEMVKRKVIEAGYTITLPEAEDFTAAAKATHIMDLPDVSDMETQRAVNRVTISLSWAV